MRIPKIIHFIWAGGQKLLPKENLLNIVKWKRMNWDFQVILWVDSTSTSQLELKYQRLYLDIQNNMPNEAWLSLAEMLTFRDISKLHNSLIYSVVRYEIDRFNPNYGVSSDLLRYAIL